MQPENTEARAPPSSHTEVASSYTGYEDWKGWTSFFTFDAEEAEYFAGEMRGLPPLKDRSVLEMGFGTGSFIAWAKSKGASVAGTEVNDRLCVEARKAGIELLEPDIEHIAEQQRERFDLIAAFDVFEHFDLAEIHARIRAVEIMLKPGGHAILRFPNGQSPFGLIPQNGDMTHKTALSLTRMEQLLLGTRLKPVRYAGSYRIGGRLGLKRIARFVRGTLQRMVGSALNLIYATRMPWDPVVVLILRKATA